MKILVRLDVSLLVWIVFLFSFIYTEHCCSEPRCRCDVIKFDVVSFSADCSHLGLEKSPDFRGNVLIINLSFNNLTNFPERNKLPTPLINLDLSYNEISKFEKNSLRNFRNMASLNLEHNNLQLHSTTYFPGIFKDLGNLSVLNLKDNIKSQDINCSYPDETFKDLVSLRTLRIDGLNNHTFGPGFLKLNKLHRLDLSGITGSCELDYLEKDAFINLRKLTYLDISDCDLLGFDKGTFSTLTQLEYLDISYNKELTFSVMQDLTEDLKYTSIKILKLEMIHCIFGLGTEIYRTDITALRDTNLTELYLGSNRLELLEVNVLGLMPKSLTKVSIGDNKLTFGYYALQAGLLKNIHTFNASLQFWSHNPMEILDKCNDTRNKRPREVSNINWSEFDNEHEVNPDQYFQNSLRNIENEDIKFYFQHLKFPIPLPTKIKVIYFNESGLRYPIPELHFYRNKIEALYLQGNILSQWIGPVKGMENIKILDLSNNYCSNISTHFFDASISLRKLYINDNLLGFDLAVDTNGDTFKSMRNLRHLEMASNKIQSLPFLIFKNMGKLKYLDLSANLLRDWKVKFDHMTQLKYLDLSRNQIIYLGKTSMQTFDDLSKSRFLRVSLSGNPLQCNCDTLEFLEWMLNHKSVEFVHFKNYTCLTKEEKYTHFSALHQEILKLQKQCTSYTGLIIAVSAGIFMFTLFVICALVYRYRWKLRYLYYMTKTKYRGYTPIRANDHSRDNYIFDAFISYADEDRQFGVHAMMKNLEEDGGLHLCLHHRDFIPGNDIAENITNAVHFSRKTVCVLTEKYIKSYWCMFELNMAHMESIYSRNGENVLFLIFYDHIAPRDMPMQLMQLIEKQSYIEYPNDPQGDVVFWVKMKETLVL